MKEKAQVKEIKGDIVTVSIAMQEGCGICANNGTCKIQKRDFSVYNKDHVDIKKGDEVVIEVPSKEQAKSAFWVLAFPLIMLFVGYGCGALLFPTSSEGLHVACAGLGFALSLGIGMLVQRRNRLDSFPYILGKEGEGAF